MKHVKVTPAFNSDRNRMADLEAPWDAARDAARDAAWDAARDAAWDAAWDAARDAATPATEQYEHWDASESGTYRLTTGQFLLASVVVIMGAIALVL